MKLLLYCTKAKPYLYHNKDYCFDTMNTIDLGYKTFKYTNQRIYNDETGKFLGWANCENMFDKNSLNGKIVAECDFEVEEIKLLEDSNATMITNTLSEEELLKKSCLEGYELCNYLYDNLWCGQSGYAIHIKNLHIFDRPKKLQLYSSMREEYRPKEKAPQNMCNVYYDEGTKHYILVPIKPDYLCQILNGEKTIEVRKKVLKEMMN